MPKSRIETLLAAFPKLISAGSQHTSAESDTVRYVYQPLEELYIMLITNKQSNILQDIQTLNLFSQVVSSICVDAQDESEITRNAFELLNAFDELISYGYKENLTLPQVKSFLEMESHEEKIQEIIARNKEMEATEERKRRAKQLEMQKREAARRGPSGSGGGGFYNQQPSYQSVPRQSTNIEAPTTYEEYQQSSNKPLAPPKGRGMQLGKKSRMGL